VQHNRNNLKIIRLFCNGQALKVQRKQFVQALEIKKDSIYFEG